MGSGAMHGHKYQVDTSHNAPQPTVIEVRPASPIKDDDEFGRDHSISCASTAPTTPRECGYGAKARSHGRLSNISSFLSKLHILHQSRQSESSDNLPIPKRHIVAIAPKAIRELYLMGDEVMPTGHMGMEVRSATRVYDQQQVVIKKRCKSTSFGCRQEEKDWRCNHEFLLNLPKSGRIAQLYEVLEDKKYYYVVMEKVTGKDLYDTSIECMNRISLDDAKDILRELLHGVAELHRNGHIHKDLKLENVMLIRNPHLVNAGEATAAAKTATSTSASNHDECENPAGAHPEHHHYVKLIDFDTIEEWPPRKQHHASNVVGTDQYIAQEAYEGKYSPASDIFAVGVIAYKLITGWFPFDPRMFDDEAGENWVGSPKMKEIQQKVKEFHINWSRPPFPSCSEAESFCRQLLAVTESERPQALQALRHPWLRGTDEVEEEASGLKAQPCYCSSSLQHRPSSASVARSFSSKAFHFVSGR